MIGFEIEDVTAEELLRVIRSLGKHRYVASRLHLVHAFAIEAAAATAPEQREDESEERGPVRTTDLEEASGWARRALGSAAIDLASRDERLYRRATDAELVAVLASFWGPAPEAARASLHARLESIGATVDEDALPFDEAAEDGVFPLLADAGWELLPLGRLEGARHEGAIRAFDDFEVARFEEENAIPPPVTLHELPAFGPVELLHAWSNSGRLRAPFVLWQDGNETYLDYVLRGVLRASKLERLQEA